MKTFIKVSLSLFAIGLLGFNLSVSSNSTTTNELSLANVEAMQASANELWCDYVTLSDCRMTSPGGTVEGRGIPRYEF